jgi:hypothetical protein
MLWIQGRRAARLPIPRKDARRFTNNETNQVFEEVEFLGHRRAQPLLLDGAPGP